MLMNSKNCLQTRLVQTISCHLRYDMTILRMLCENGSAALFMFRCCFYVLALLFVIKCIFFRPVALFSL